MAGLSLITWWPLRAILLAAVVVVVGLLVWRGRRWWSRATLVLLLLVLLPANVLTGINAHYGYYLTLGQAAGLPDPDTASTASLNRHTEPDNGVVVTIDIPGKDSRFTARRAEVYLPPAWFARARPHLPVLVLLHGTPGGPTDWVGVGMAQLTLDTWAHRHHGIAPIVVMPDINGSLNGDTECVNSPRGRVETYLSVDVPNFVRTRFFTQPPGKHWAVAGLSEGGSCALMLALRHPSVFTTFGDYSGLAGPRSGQTNDPAGTVAQLFAGSRRAFLEHEPSWLLAHHRYPQLAGWLEVGSDDTNAEAAARTLAPLARHAGITTRLVTIPGDGHTFALWRAALADSLPWIDEHISGDTALASADHPR